MGIMTSSESAPLWRVKIDISAMLTDTSGLDSHMIRNWTHMIFGEGNLVEVATSVIKYINDDDFIILLILLHLVKG
jgi:hypothetical protein